MAEQKTKTRRLNVPVTPDDYANIELAVMHFRSQDPDATGKATDAEVGAIVATVMGQWRKDQLK